jgi:hypothetical protein
MRRWGPILKGPAAVDIKHLSNSSVLAYQSLLSPGRTAKPPSVLPQKRAHSSQSPIARPKRLNCAPLAVLPAHNTARWPPSSKWALLQTWPSAAPTPPWIAGVTPAQPQLRRTQHMHSLCTRTCMSPAPLAPPSRLAGFASYLRTTRHVLTCLRPVCLRFFGLLARDASEPRP